MKQKKINTPTLKTERLILRKFAKFDLKALFNILSDEKINEYLPWIKIENIEEAEFFLKERFLDYYNLENAFRYAVCLKEDNIPIGYVWLSNDSSHDLGYGLRSDYWNKGIISEAALKIVELLSKTNIGYITATHDINNPASGKIMEKIGMTYKYSYVEQWMPKNKEVTFRMYQLNFKTNDFFIYEEYKEKHPNKFIENI